VYTCNRGFTSAITAVPWYRQRGFKDDVTVLVLSDSAKDIVEKFKALDKDGSGKLDVAEASEELKTHGMGEKEIEFFINSSTGDDGQIDIGEFAGLLLKLKVYEQRKKS